MDEIKLSLDNAAMLAPAPEEKAISGKYMEDVNLTDEEKKAVADFAQKIDLKDSNVTMMYGAASQQKIAEQNCQNVIYFVLIHTCSR